MNALKRFFLQFDDYSFPESPMMDDGYGEEESDSILGISKSSLPKIAVIGVILLIGGYFVLDYLVFSVKQVEVNVFNLESRPVNSIMKVIDSEGNEIVKLSGDSVHSFSLRRGDYTVRISANDYKSDSQSLNAGDFSDDIVLDFELEKTINVSIKEIQLPASAFKGQSVQGKILLENASGQTESVELILSGSPDNADVNLPLNETPVPSGKITEVPFTLAVHDNIRRISSSGTQISGKVRIKYTNATAEFSLLVFKEPDISLPSKVSFSGVDMTKETDYSEEFKVSNKSDVETPEITARIELTDAGENSLADAEGWISFSETGSKELSFSLTGKGSKDIVIDLAAPLTAKKDTITGKIIFSADFLDEDKEVSLSIKISKEAVLDVTAVLKPSDSLEVPFDEDNLQFDEISTHYIEIENNGTIPVTNVDLLLLNQNECSDNYLTIDGSTFFNSIQPNAVEKIDLTASMPLSDRDGGIQKECSFTVQYRHPLDDSKQTIDLLLTIEQET